ncbi:MAG: hypothetical protein KKI18_01105 [Planctomycetes bacterium]|nr:hypothetical protein [Planctomycetota bacterium]MBU1517502.1 hypothetical protein [Planctomycetota bacterium]
MWYNFIGKWTRVGIMAQYRHFGKDLKARTSIEAIKNEKDHQRDKDSFNY